MRWLARWALPLWALCGAEAAAQGIAAEAPAGLRCLVESYPGRLCGATADALIWCDGERTPWGPPATPWADEAARLDGATIYEQMEARYRPGASFPTPQEGDDPGRARDERFFRKMYGGDARAVKATLAPVVWLPGVSGAVLQVTTVNGVDERLRAVSEELGRLPPELLRRVAKPSGAFHWRAIKGTKRLSLHSFAVAVDVGVERSDYWRWTKPDAQGRYVWRNRIPLEVVEVFERHGFLWGGKWYHFDTMHFEYRPELLHPLCRAR